MNQRLRGREHLHRGFQLFVPQEDLPAGTVFQHAEKYHLFKSYLGKVKRCLSKFHDMLLNLGGKEV